MSANYPTSLDDGITLPEPTTGSTIPAAADTNRSDAIKELEAKVGIGASNSADATDGQVLTKQGDGTSAWEAIPSQAADTQTLTNKTIDGDNNTVSNLDIGNEVDWPTASDVTDRTAFASGDKLLIQEAGVGLRKIDYDDLPGASGGLSNIVEDTTPQLGGQLDVNGNAIGDGTNELLTFVEDASAVNNVEIENEATGAGPIIRSTGTDANVDLDIATKGTGSINLEANVTTTGTIDGRDVAADGTKLDGVETGATADQTGAEIKTAYEAEADTNAFTDADHTKLDGIATGAEVNPDVISQAEAEAGTATTERIFTAQRVKQAIDALGGGGGGGGNPYNADLVVAASGGDYTTVGEALANASAGDVVYVEPGTYAETAARTLSANEVTLIGHDMNQTKVQLGSYNLTITGTDGVFKNICFDMNGSGYINGSNNHEHTFKDMRFLMNSSSPNYAIYATGARVDINNCRAEGTGSLPSYLFRCTGERSTIHDNKISIRSVGAYTGVIGVTGQHCKVDNNQIELAIPVTNSRGIILDGNYSTATGNNVKNVYECIRTDAAYHMVTGNSCYTMNNGRGIYAIGNYGNHSGNMIYVQGGGTGIYTDLSNQNISGNMLVGSNSGTGIYMNNNDDNNSVVGNSIHLFNTGVNISGSGCDNSLIASNQLIQCTTKISDSGTGTMSVTATDSDPLNKVS